MYLSGCLYMQWFFMAVGPPTVEMHLPQISPLSLTVSYTCRSFRDAGQGGVAAFDYLNSRGGWIRSARPTRKGGLIVLVILGGERLLRCLKTS